MLLRNKRILLLALLPLLLVSVVYAATRYEHYIVGNSSFLNLWTTTWESQTFTPEISHSVGSVKLQSFRSGDVSPGTITMSIRNTSAGFPTGVDLVSCTYDSNSIPMVYPGVLIGCSFDLPIILNKDVTYAIVVRALGADVDNQFVLVYDHDSSGYSGGDLAESLDSGGTWAFSGAQGESDFLFEEYGVSAYCEGATGAECIASLVGLNDTFGRMVFLLLGAIIVVGVGLAVGVHMVILAAILLLFLTAFTIVGWVAGAALVTVILIGGIFTLVKIIPSGSG